MSMHVHVLTHARGGQKPTLGVFLYSSPLQFVRQALS